ncbi:MAG: alcohol dehydrogenase catalytic domain-containing protein [Micromonosporaceae bacterium]|nr:alcohol dehydrogenase catalytic domain-containing protein [Micromonosporaceae bacterium]
MKIAVLTAPGTFEIADEPPPTCGPDEILVRVAACGVCASELDTWQGRGAADFPRHPGHEVSGTVLEAGPEVSTLTPGDAVAVWTVERGFAEFVAAKADRCRPARDLPAEEALLEPVACAVNAVELADVRLGDDVVIIGAGFMGNLVQQLVALRGARHVIVADTRADALKRARRLGATAVVDSLAESLPRAVRGLTDGNGADVTFEVTGAQGPLELVGDTTRMSGKIVLVGFHQGAPRKLPLGHWNWMAFQIVNAHFRELPTIMRGMTAGMRLLTSRRLSLDGLVTHRFALADINEAFRTAVEKPEGFVKATVTVSAADEAAPGQVEAR